ncbi:MAG: TonB-dependent receptor [Flavobacteriales bacterium]|nr:TonB-dependent receptor [Flavobacteriales bacterium]
MISRLLTILFICFYSMGMAQGRPGGKGKGGGLEQIKYSVLGKLQDPDHNEIPYASIVLYNSNDSSVAGGSASNENGYFEILVPNGRYYLQASFLSYETHTISGLEVSDADINLKTIEMTPSAKALEEIVVEAERPQMELKLDKRVFNVDKDLTNRGRNAVDILENIPSVNVDVEGNVSLRNSQNVRILIDGKPSSLVGASGNDALRMLQGDQVEKIEIITNPSARYDAEGEVGIINIVLKKNKSKGFNGLFELRGGYPNMAGASYTLNYRQDKLNLFTGYGVNYRERPGYGTNYHRFDKPDTTFGYTSERKHSRNGTNQNFRAGASYDFNKYNSVSLAGDYSIGKGMNNAQLIYNDFDIYGEFTQTSDRNEEEYQENSNGSVNFNYTRLFKRKEMKWTVDASAYGSFSFEDADIVETSTNPVISPLIQTASTVENEQNRLVQTDFIMPIGKEGKFETGGKMNLRTINNDYLVEELQGTGYVALPNLDNQMIYTENIYAAYIMAGNKTGKVSYQAGLRTEYSDIKTDFKRTNEVNPRDYLSLFPSANLSYEFKKDQFLQLSYSRRISRPRHWFLFPFYNLSDNRNISMGNPNLNPTFTDAFEIGYMKKWEKANLLISPYYRYSTGLTERILLADTNGISYRFPINLGFGNAYGLELSGSYDLSKWWNLNGSFNFYRQTTDGNYEGQRFSSDTYAWTTRMVSKWSIKRVFSFQASLNYNSKEKTTQGEQLARYNVDLAAALDMLKGKGTLTLSVRDLFNTRLRRNITYGPDFYDESEFQWMSRYGQLTFSYRLNQSKKSQRGNGSGDFGGGDMDM